MRAQVMVVGVYHLGETSDLISIQSKKDNEMGMQAKEVVEALSVFKPTMLAVEVESNAQLQLNETYQTYQRGNLVSPKDEIGYIGFPLAKAAGISEISCVDWRGDAEEIPPIEEVLQYASEREPELYNRLIEKHMEAMQREAEKLSELSIFEAFKLINEPQTIKDLHQFYMDFAMIGKEKDYYAMDWLTWWYKRNLVIYSNVRRLISSPQDRVLLLIGGAHVHLINQFLVESDMCTVVDASDYLK